MKRNNRYIASIILLLVTIGFLASCLFNETFAGKLLMALFGASMIGGIADWFGITALFRKPLGIPFRTEIIPRSRKKIFDSLIDMVENELLTKEALKSKLDKFDISKKLIIYLMEQDGKKELSLLACRIVADMLHKIDPDQAGTYLERLINENSENIEVFPLFSNAVEWLSKNGQDERVISRVIDELKDFILYPKVALLINTLVGDFFKRIKQNAEKETTGKKLFFKFVLTLADFSDMSPSKLSSRLLTEALEYLNRIKEPESIQRKGFERWLDKNTTEIKTNPALHEKVEQKGLDILKRISLSSTISNYVYPYFKNEKQMEKLQVFIESIVEKLVDDFSRNLDEQEKLDSFVKNSIMQMIEENHAEIGRMVRQKLELYSNDMLVSLIEEKAGNDLQIIRINGSMVGGIVGVILFLLTFWIK